MLDSSLNRVLELIQEGANEIDRLGVGEEPLLTGRQDPAGCAAWKIVRCVHRIASYVVYHPHVEAHELKQRLTPLERAIAEAASLEMQDEKSWEGRDAESG